MKVGIAKLTQSGDYVLESLADGPNTVEQGGFGRSLKRVDMSLLNPRLLSSHLKRETSMARDTSLDLPPDT